MNLFNQSLLLSGYPLRKATAKLAEISSKNPKDFESWHNEQIWRIFNYHYVNNKFYKKIIDTKTRSKPENWNDIPTLSKGDFQRPIHEMLSISYTQNSVYVSNTSGSSGHPFYFAKDKLCHALTWAQLRERYSRYGINYGSSLQARFYGIPLSKRKLMLEKTKDMISARYRFPIFNLSDSVFNSYIRIFRKRKFEYLNGYTSVLVLFAKYLNIQGVILKDICPSLKVVFPTAEMLIEEDRQSMEKSFGVPIVNEYGASELGVIAIEDEELDWIVSDENLLLEIIDDDDNVLGREQEGRIVITSLANEAMPFIRYEIGDIGCLSKYKKGNNSILKSIRGRTNDFVVLPSGKKSPGLTFYYISKSLLENGGFMREFIIQQLDFNHFHFQYVSDLPLTNSQKYQINEALELYLEPNLKATFERKEFIERSRSGKLKHFQSLVNN